MVAIVPTAPSSVSANSTIVVPAPAPAAQAFPSLTGRWRVSGRMTFRNLSTGGSLPWGSCSGSYTIASQEGGTFSGSFGTQGGGFNSDRFCTHAGTLTGLFMAAGDFIEARFDRSLDRSQWTLPSVTPSCQILAPAEHWTGTATTDAMQVQMTDTVRCAVNVDGGSPTMPMADFERTVMLDFTRW